MMKKVVKRQHLMMGLLLCAVLSMTAVAIAPDPNGIESQTFMTLFYSSIALQVLSWAGVPILGWFVRSRVCVIRRRVQKNVAPRSHAQMILIGQYAGFMLVLALVCEAPYDFIQSGRWWNLSSQNPIWGIVISLVTCLVWDALESYGNRPKRNLRILVIFASVIWAIVFQVLVSIVIFTEIFLLWSPDYIYAWKKISVNRQLMLLCSSIVCGVTPLIGLAALRRYGRQETIHKQSRRNHPLLQQWFLWWAYPVLLLIGVIVRIVIIKWGM